MMKKLIFLVSIVLIGLLNSCQNGSSSKEHSSEPDHRRIEKTRNEIAESARNTNSKCPIYEAVGFVITSVSFKDSIWRYECSIDESLLRVDSLVNHPKIVEDMAINWVSSAINNDSIIEELVYSRIYLQYDMMGSISQKHIITTITPEQIAEAYYLNEDISEKNRKKIASSLALANAGCPLQLDEITRMQGCRFDGVNVLYDYIILETQGIDLSDKYYGEMFAEVSKDMIQEQFLAGTPEFEKRALELFDMCISIEANLIYNYRGSKSKNLVQVIITPKDMANLSNKIRR